MKTGLVLEGGAMRGMFTCGIIDIFINNDIKFDGVVGVSAGAIFGVNYPSKQAGRVISYNLEYIKDKRYMGLGSLIKTGDLINKDFAYYTVPLEYYPFDFETYHNSGIPFYACVTNMETGQPEYYQINDFDFGMEVLRASASMPFVTRPVMLNGKPFLLVGDDELRAVVGDRLYLVDPKGKVYTSKGLGYPVDCDEAGFTPTYYVTSGYIRYTLEG